MATNHPIDQLFREKLANTELKPSAEAWELLQQRTQKKGSTGFLRVAAAIALLCTASLSYWWLQYQGQEELSMGDPIEVTAPNPLASNLLEIPKRSFTLPKSDVLPIEPVNALGNDPLTIEEPQYVATETPMIHPSSLKASNLMKLSMDVPPVQFELGENNKINIFYYTQATPAEPDASKRKLAKIIDYARTANPVDWVGDFRNKKDEWLDNVFSLDE